MNTTFKTDELLLNDIDDDLDDDADEEVAVPGTPAEPVEPVEGDEGWPAEDVPEEVPPTDEY